MGKMYFPDEVPSQKLSTLEQLRDLERRIRKYKLIFVLEVIVIVVCILVAIFMF